MAFDIAPSPIRSVAPESVGKICARHAGSAACELCTRCGDYLCTACVATPPGVATLCAPCADAVRVPQYYAVPVWRFLVLSLCTLGLYNTYWGYRCWRAVKARDGSDIWPIPRALFLTFTYMSLMEDMNEQRAHRGLVPVHTAWAGAYLVTSIASRLLDRFTGEDPLSIALSLGATMLATTMLMPGLTAMRELATPRELAERDKLRPRHVVVMIAGALLMLLMVVGALYPDVAPAEG